MAQLESCEAGFGSNCTWGQQPRRSSVRARKLRCCSPTGKAAEQRELELQRCDKGQRALLAAYGLDDKLVAALALKAEGKKSVAV